MPEDFENVINAGDRFAKKREEAPEVLVLDMPELRNHPMSEVSEHILKTYSNEYIVPDISFFDKLKTMSKDQLRWLKAGERYFLFGQAVQNDKGNWCVPGIAYDLEAGWHQQLFVLKGPWLTNFRAVLIKK